jgi:nucleotide-binding universal stress UspA family protein
MYKKILVPLDGSELAECVLPHVESIATGCSVLNVILLRVVEPFHAHGTGAEYRLTEGLRAEIDKQSKADAEKYLNEVSKRIKHEGVNSQTKIIVGNPAETIVDYATKQGIDLIIMATHGRSGVGRWVWGSVADRVLHFARAPVLMVRALQHS